MSITRRVALLSVGASIVTLLLKFGAYYLTNSVGLLSDAAESGVNLTAALIAFAAITIADRPADENHSYGHDKAEYFSSGAEGALILVAAVTILYAAGKRILNPAPVENVGIGVAVAAIASTINFAVSRIMLRVSKEHDSIALEADAHHLMTDVWTSVGVIAGVALVSLTGWLWLDPVIAMIVALQIVVTGLKLVRSSANGLLDAGLPEEEVSRLRAILDHYQAEGVSYHALRTRQAGVQRFVSVHIQVPGNWSVQRGHELLEMIEYQMRQEMSPVNVTAHLEPVEDPASWYDAALNRED